MQLITFALGNHIFPQADNNCLLNETQPKNRTLRGNACWGQEKETKAV